MTAHRPLRIRLVALLAAPLAVLAALSGAAPATAAPASLTKHVAKYVALGDSYAAGVGAGGYINNCSVSPSGYPYLLDSRPRIRLLRNAACSGATIADVASSQLRAVNRGTTLVTVTAGGNDVNVFELYAACAEDSTTADCAGAITTIRTRIATVGPKMRKLVREIRKRAPRATIIVTGYPRPFADSAAAAVPVAGIVNAAIDGIDTQLSRASQASCARFAPVSFGEHALFGSDASWMIGDPADPGFGHPTAAGYVAYRDAIRAVL